MSSILSKFMDDENQSKIKALKNKYVEEEIERFLKLCKPEKVLVFTDSPEDIASVSNLAIELGEELPLEMKGHTVHYDSYFDQARDKENTRVLKPPEMKMSRARAYYSLEEYDQQFSIRLDKYLKKWERMQKIFGQEEDIPKDFWDVHQRVKMELDLLKKESRESLVSPSYFL